MYRSGAKEDELTVNSLGMRMKMFWEQGWIYRMAGVWCICVLGNKLAWKLKTKVQCWDPVWIHQKHYTTKPLLLGLQIAHTFCNPNLHPNLMHNTNVCLNHNIFNIPYTSSTVDAGTSQWQAWGYHGSSWQKQHSLSSSVKLVSLTTIVIQRKMDMMKTWGRSVSRTRMRTGPGGFVVYHHDACLLL